MDRSERAKSKPPFWKRTAAWSMSLPRGVRAALLVAFLLHGCALWWGMPASDAWDNDGIAPRDFLPGLAETFTPGHYFTYPPLHLALLALLTLPATLIAAFRAGSTSVPIVLREIIEPPYMTSMAITARVVSLVMSLGIIVALARIAEEIARARHGSPRDAQQGAEDASDIEPPPGDERAARVATCVAWFAALGAPFTYYSKSSNLDVPYLFWAMLAALALTRAIVRHEPRRLRSVALFAACGVATKDQAYAVFVLAAPTLFVLWFALDTWARQNVRMILRELAIAVGIGALLLAVVDGAIFNPSGFRARLAFLAGPASQDFAQYSKDAHGRWLALVDTGRAFRLHYPWVLALFVGIGLPAAVRTGLRRGRAAFVASLLPLLLTLSFTITFNLVARRVEERFTMPQALFLAVYGGFGLEALWYAFRFTSEFTSGSGSAAASGSMPASSSPPAVWALRMRPVSWVLRAGCLFAMGLALYECVRVDATLIREPRYQTEAFLERNVAAGDVIEVHGLNTYLPRFPTRATVVRVGPTAPEKRGPLPGVQEVQAPFLDIGKRNPKWVVASDCFTWRYLERGDVDMNATAGRVVPKTQGQDASNADGTAFFRGLYGWRLGYHSVDDARVPEDGLFPRIPMHASLGCRTFTFVRNGSPEPH